MALQASQWMILSSIISEDRLDIWAVLPRLCIFLLQLKKIGIYDPLVEVLLDK